MTAIQICWADTEYKELDDGVRDLVKSLHLLGIRTIMSCEGHIRTAWYYVGVLPWPWVIIAVTPEQMASLQQKLYFWNRLNPQKQWILSVERIHGSFTPEYVRGMIKREFPGCQVRSLVPRNENMSLDPNILIAMRMQAIELASFLQRPS